MATFAIITNRSLPSLEADLKQKYPEHRKLSEFAYFVKANSTAAALTNELLTLPGIHNGAVIFRITADYYGYARTDFWDWIASSFVEGDGA